LAGISEDNNRKSGLVARAGIWYIACNFINKGIGFLTTPIFTRILSKTVIGEFSNFLVWLNILTLIITMDMHVTVPRARFDYEKDIDKYISSITILSTFSTLVFSFVIFMFKDFFCNIMGISLNMLYMILLLILFSGSFQIFQIRHRLQYKYKMFAFLTLALNVSSVLLSLLFVFLFKDKLAGRIIGYSVPRVIIYIILFCVLVYKGKGIKIEHVKYCLKICLPYIPHLLSLYILSASDRTMIKTLCSAEDLAIYSLGYSFGTLISLLASSMNQAWSPWLSEQLHNKLYKNTQKWSIYYIALFMLFSFFLGLLAPEVVYILGGKAYQESIYVLPPILTGIIYQFIYTMYVNIETYNKKTIGMSIATCIAAGLNIILNYIFIPIFGFIAAAFTTLAGYAVLFLIHYYLVRRMGMTIVYKSKKVFLLLLISLVYIPIFYYFYYHTLQRYISIFAVVGLVLVVCYREKSKVVHFISMIFPNFFNRRKGSV